MRRVKQCGTYRAAAALERASGGREWEESTMSHQTGPNGNWVDERMSVRDDDDDGAGGPGTREAS